MKTLIIDNYDSFTYNLAQYCAELGANPDVIRNDAITIDEIERAHYTHIIISPGPGSPDNEKDFGVCGRVIRHFMSRLPILGVCLGHQGIIHELGGKVIRAPLPVHGKRSQIHVRGESRLFKGLGETIEGMRYHSLVGDAQSIPVELEITATTDDGLVMAVQHKEFPLYGIQFHPESVGTPDGKQILRNFFFGGDGATGAARKGYSAAETEKIVDDMAEGRMTEEDAEHFLREIAARGETAEEVIGAVRSMRAHALPLPYDSEKEGPLMDTCGTGGSGLARLNTSTIAAFVLAAAGVRVAKHGNRAASGRCGSFDLLEALGINIELSPDAVAKAIRTLNIGFLFAPMFHPAMKNIAPIRKKLGIRTIFNILGPLTNPARLAFHVLGTPSIKIAETMVGAMRELAYTRALVVAGSDGLDDITLTGDTEMFELFGNKISRKTFSPEEIGMARVNPSDITTAGNPKENAALTLALLQGKGPRPLKNLLLVNCAFGLYVRGMVKTPLEGVDRARTILDSGTAYQKFLDYKDFSHANSL